MSEAAERIAAAVPAVVARAAVDWHFRGPLAELEQLEQWPGAQISFLLTLLCTILALFFIFLHHFVPR